MTRAGLVAVAGKPNVGKSTLLNRLVGQKLSITSPKPQSTRNLIVGIRSDGETQMVLLDTPGLLDPRYELQRAMRATARRAILDADVILYLGDATAAPPEPLHVAAELPAPPRTPVLTVLNKADLLTPDTRTRLEAAVPHALLVSAATGDGIDMLLNAVRHHLPESPFLYDADDLATQPLRFFAAELVRESALEQLSDEVPYSLAVQVEEFREDRSPVYIRAVLYVERESQKRILIGHRGARIREIGQAARTKIEALLGEQDVYLDLWVKVLPHWRRDPRALRRFGYAPPEESST
jgi:GTP-binding protein Era